MRRVFRHEKVRFLTVGLLNTWLDFVLLNIFVFSLGAIPLLGNLVSVSIGITISYVLNHKFVFRASDKLSLKKYMSFFAVTGFSSLILQSLIIIGFSEIFKSPITHSLFIIKDLARSQFLQLNIAKAAAVLVGMVWNFMIYKHIIFKKLPAIDFSELEEKSE